jgi:hypothetical protein
MASLEDARSRNAEELRYVAGVVSPRVIDAFAAPPPELIRGVAD